MKITLPYQVVLLVRGEGAKVPLVVLPHEVEVLRITHGEESIVETDAVPPIKEATFETEDEYARLEQYYKGHADLANPTREVWRTLDVFESSFQPQDSAKEELLAEAISLGIKATAKWSVAKLQEAISAKLDA